MNAKRFLTLLQLAAATAVFAQEGEAVKNGGFESILNGTAEHWSKPPAHYSWQAGAGRNGTAGLCFDNDDPAFYTFPGQRVALKPGKAYRYSVWVRTENLTGSESGATICIEWYDRNGKWMGGSYANGVKGTTADWVKIEGITPGIPDEAVSIGVHPYVRKGMVGKAWFDDVSVTPYIRPPVTGVYSSTYRNIAERNEVSFHAALWIDEDTVPLDTVRGTFHFRNAEGKAVSKSADVLTSQEARLVLQATELAEGKQTIRFELTKANGEKIGEGSVDFTRVKKMPERKVWIDEWRRVIVDGKPFFPLGMYWSGVQERELDIYKQGPFNCLMPYQAPNREQLDMCHARGLKVIYSVKDIYYGTKWAPKSVKSAEDEVAFIEKRVQDYGKHPAVMAWYINDELPISMLQRLSERQQLMERLDADHPTWVVLYQYDQIRDYLPTFDVVGTDPYPIPSKPVSVATRWTRATYNGVFGKRAMWQVPQAFNWDVYKQAEERGKNRSPTRDELRSMAWQCVAGGANGLVFYSFFDLFKKTEGEDFETRWGNVRAVADEIASKIPVLLAVGPTPKVSGMPAGVEVRCWNRDGEIYLLAVNSTDQPTTAALTFDRKFSGAEPEFGPRPEWKENRLTFSLKPAEPAMFRLK